MKFHNLLSLFRTGWKQKTTWIGIGCLMWFFYTFYDAIYTLILNILHSPELASEIAEGLGSGITGVILVLFKKIGNKDDNDN